MVHVAILVACMIALLAKTPKELRHPAGYVFGHVEGVSGWNPAGWGYIFGALSVSWTMGSSTTWRSGQMLMPGSETLRFLVAWSYELT
jgi:hypothetical protein